MVLWVHIPLTQRCVDKSSKNGDDNKPVSLLDLRKTYLQILVDKALWPYQTMILKVQSYCLTRLGFSLNVAPPIMQSIIDSVMSHDRSIKNASSTYTDNIYINESLVPAHCMREHLSDYGLARIQRNWKTEL